MNTALKFEAPFEKLYDLGMIDKLCRGDISKTKKMLELFIHDIPASVEEIKQAYKRLDYITLKKTAHRIKPVFALYSIVKIEKDIAMIENSGIEERVTPELESKINHLSSIIGEVTQQMNAYIS
jgi:HPt (histidine-containing phosphotransfer) domain-containing protein